MASGLTEGVKQSMACSVEHVRCACDQRGLHSRVTSQDEVGDADHYVHVLCSNHKIMGESWA
jgi:hypothetical protein